MGYTPAFDAVDTNETTNTTYMDLGRTLDTARMKRDMLRFMGLAMDPMNGVTYVRGKTVQLAASERELLSVLLRRAGQIVSRERLSGLLGISGAALDARVEDLRSHLRAAGAACLPTSAEGLGYILWRC
ncbi:MAG TPA: helix-turn-helix domain-containing protein [Ktedonobacterales bacterium]|nr:helix-turn-helix domain-containing protein [Ktedonobacterales bacterium]